jgi:hypothetical protein
MSSKVIRCPSSKVRNHSSYDTCGSFIAALVDEKVILYCSKCSSLYQLVIHPNTIELKRLPKSTIKSDPFLEVLS